MSGALLLTEPEEATRSFLRAAPAPGRVRGGRGGEREALDLLERARTSCCWAAIPKGPSSAGGCARASLDGPGIARCLCPARPGGVGSSRPGARFRPRLRRLPRSPFHLRRARRAHPSGSPAEDAAGARLQAGEIEIDRPTRRVTVAGERIVLPTKEYELLLKRRATSARLHEGGAAREVWGFRSYGRTRTLDSTPHGSRAASPGRDSGVRPERLGRGLLPARRLTAAEQARGHPHGCSSIGHEQLARLEQRLQATEHVAPSAGDALGRLRRSFEPVVHDGQLGDARSCASISQLTRLGCSSAESSSKRASARCERADAVAPFSTSPSTQTRSLGHCWT